MIFHNQKGTKLLGVGLKPLVTRTNIFVAFDELTSGRESLVIGQFSYIWSNLKFHNPQKFVPVKSFNIFCYMGESIQILTNWWYISTITISKN